MAMHNLTHSHHLCKIVTEDFCIPEHYNKHQRPNASETLNVQVKFSVNQVTSVDDSSFTISLMMFIMLYWKDERVQYSGNNSHTLAEDVPLNVEWSEKLWLPDTFVWNMKSVKKPQLLQEFESEYQYVNTKYGNFIIFFFSSNLCEEL